MRKERPWKLDRYVDQLEQWFEVEKITYVEAAQRLQDLGCKVSFNTVCNWYRAHRAKRLQRQILEQIARAADSCKEIELQFSQHPAPAIETLIKLHRVLALDLSTQAQETPAKVQLVATLMKPLLDWTRLEEQRKQRELQQQQKREEAEAQREAPKGLTAETLERIERELKLL